MKRAKDLSKAERSEIAILLGKAYSLRSIASALKRSPNTISYEVAKNSTNGTYDPIKAHAKARLRKRMRKLEWAKINECGSLQDFVIKKLREHWNPDEIAGHLKRYPVRYPWYVSKTAIYDWLRTARGERYCIYLYSQRKRKRKRMAKTKRMLIPHRVSIRKRFLGANNRTRYGHWEADTIVGRRGTSGGIKTALERKSKLFIAQKVSSMRPKEHSAVLRKMLAPLKVNSATFDNGIENRCHQELGVPTFFCDAYASWQKGANENGNKMLRRYFPKGTDFREISQKEIDRAVARINAKPRKSLGYRSALEVAQEAGMMSGIH